jgi:hypothetical protein
MDTRRRRETAGTESERRGIGQVVVVAIVATVVASSFVGVMTLGAASTALASGSATTTALDPTSETIPLEPTVEWYQSYGGSRADSVVEANDGTFVVSQALDSGGDVRLLRIDATGAAVPGWPKEYAVATSTARNPQIVVGTADGGFAVAGTTPFYVLKIDNAGTVQWLYQGAPRAFVYGVIQTSDGGYLAVGDTVANQEMHVTKLDANGNLVWNRTFSDMNYGSARGVVEADGAYAVTGKVNYQSNRNPFFMRLDPATGDRLPFADSSLYRVYSAYSGSSFDEVIFDDGRYVVAGWGPFTNGNGLLVALDTAGNDEHLGTYTAGNIFGHIESTPDGYVLSGYLYPSDAWVVKTDKSGALQWELFVGQNNGVFEFGGQIIRTSDGGYLLPGSRTDRSFSTYDAFVARLGPEPIDAVDVAIETPTNGAVVNTGTVTLAGTATSTESTVTSVEVSDDGGVTFDPATTFDGLNWTYEYAAAGNGENTLAVKATDALGAFDSEQVTVTVDTTPPIIEAVLFDTTLVAAGDSVGVTVSVSDANGVEGVTADGTSLTQDASGNWTGTLTAPTTDGMVAVSVVATDVAGNQASDSASYTVDATAPLVTLSAPAESTTGIVEVTGTVTDGVGIESITLDVNSGARLISIDPAGLDATGDFSETVTLTQGENTLVLEAIDSVGNANSTSTTVTVTLVTDGDGDGLTDEEEVVLGTDPTLADTDGDGLGDGDEVDTYGTNPLVVDTDGDGLSDGDEVDTYATDPTSGDTDSGGVDDGTEIAAGTNPLDGTDDAYAIDSDGDGLSDGHEADLGTDPNDSDSDADGLSDGDEIAAGTDPTVADTDGDGLGDDEEVAQYGTDPTNADSDGDGLSDGDEINQYGTDPTTPDTTVTIDVKPDSDGENAKSPINLKSKGGIPVAIFGDETLDSTTIDVTSVRFGPDEVSPLRTSVEDVNGDGYTDLVVFFDQETAGFTAGDATVVLTGSTRGGTPIVGTDAITVVGE